jgi:hypothetical protein
MKHCIKNERNCDGRNRVWRSAEEHWWKTKPEEAKASRKDTMKGNM